MKYLVKISMAIFAAGLILSSCEKPNESTGFELSTDAITVGAEGGTERIKISASGKWVASTEAPWITISPANGIGSIDCQIKIDTTLLADKMREASVRFISSENADPLTLRVKQTGFEKMITLSSTEMEIPNYGDYSKRTFEVELTSNVDFEIKIPTEAKSWLTCDDYEFDLDRGARPRTVKLKFTWQNNNIPIERMAEVSFLPKDNNEEVSHLDKLKVLQDMGLVIEDSRQGDSIAIIACKRSLNSSMGSDEGEAMSNWSFVTLWEPTHEGFEESKRGRVRSVTFQSSSTYDGIPYELRYLKTAEEIVFYSNGNKFLKDFSTGESLGELTQLKRLQIYAFGLSSIDESFANLKNLEVLDLSGNNFNEVPQILNPENFPKLRSLNLSSNRRRVIFDMTTTTVDEDKWGGFRGEFPEHLLRWDSLEYLYLSYNYMWGEIPDMLGYEKKYTQADLDANDTLPDRLLNAPKVLPIAKLFYINLNLFEGTIPDWILYHPHLLEWYPETMVFNQDEIINKDGNKPGFTNVPVSPDYYFQEYPLKKPDNYDD